MTGVFGKLILQVPVTGGYEGGKLRVEKPNQVSTEFDFQRQSHRFYYATVFLSDCQHYWQPIVKGYMVALEFDLVWRPCPALVISAIRLPEFLTSVKLVKEALSAWSNDDLLPAAGSGVLAVPLEETYYHTNFSFSALSGNDRKMAQILQSVDFIDLHLAVVTKVTEDGEKSSTYKIVQWIYSSKSLPQFQNYLNLKKYLVGEIKTSLLDTMGASLSEDLYPMLIIQPQRHSILRCCSSQFDVMLNHLESLLLSDGESSVMRMHSASCLEQVLSYCQTEPLKVWKGVPESKASERIGRLFDICRDLQAQKEGLLLLEILGKVATNDFNPPAVFYERVDNEPFARSIINMIMKTGGKTFPKRKST